MIGFPLLQMTSGQDFLLNESAEEAVSLMFVSVDCNLGLELFLPVT